MTEIHIHMSLIRVAHVNEAVHIAWRPPRIHIYLYICIYTYVYMCIYVCIDIYIYINIYAHM